MFFFNRSLYSLTIGLGLAVWGNWHPVMAQTLPQSPIPVNKQEAAQETEAFPLRQIARELATEVEKLSGKKQAAFFYGIIPDWLRRVVFWNLSTPAQKELNSVGMQLTVQQFPQLRSGLSSLEAKSKNALEQAGRERYNPQTMILRGQSFLSGLTEDEKALWAAFAKRFFPSTFYESGYRTLTLTPAGAQSLLPLAPFSPTLNKVLSRKQFIPENQPGRAGDHVFTVSIDEIPIVKVVRKTTPPAGEKKRTDEKGPFATNDNPDGHRHSEPRENKNSPDDRPEDSGAPMPVSSGMTSAWALCNCFISESCPPPPRSSYQDFDHFYYYESVCSPEPECMSSVVPPPGSGDDDPIFYPPYASPCSFGIWYFPCSGRCGFLRIEVYCCS